MIFHFFHLWLSDWVCPMRTEGAMVQGRPIDVASAVFRHVPAQVLEFFRTGEHL